MNQNMAGKGRFQVIELFDPADPTLPRYVAAQRQGEPAWYVTWEHREQLPGKLAAWFRELAAEGREPAERVMLGRGTGLTAGAAFALARFRVGEICRMAGCEPDQVPDFLTVDLPANVGGRGRPTTVVEADGTVTTYPSIAALASADGVARETRSRAVRRGLRGRDGRSAL